MVLLYSEFTLLSNNVLGDDKLVKFYCILNLHYSQTFSLSINLPAQFYCILNLHYSQTVATFFLGFTLFYCILNLHYSQTTKPAPAQNPVFYCILNLHYSQTGANRFFRLRQVLLYSEFTLLSNLFMPVRIACTVLLYSEFTLLSNIRQYQNHWSRVLLYSEFTLLSNHQHCTAKILYGFTVFWIYTTLKQTMCHLSEHYLFYCILNLHYSQTQIYAVKGRVWFYCILNLHYSQTQCRRYRLGNQFYCILNLHYSQTSNLSGNRYTALQLR